MKPRIVIDRLDLDLRGIDPALARAAVQQLAAALRARLQAGLPPAAAATADLGLAASPATPDALAAHLAQQIARRLPGV
jgi:hypothetical protein